MKPELIIKMLEQQREISYEKLLDGRISISEHNNKCIKIHREIEELKRSVKNGKIN